MKRIIAILSAVSLLFLTACAFGGGNYTFTEDNFPKIGGSLCAENFAKVIVTTATENKITDANSTIDFSNTTSNAYKALCNGELDILLAYKPNSQTLEYLEENGCEIEMTEIAKDALIIICSGENSVDGLKMSQVKKIYSGEISSWNEVGGEEWKILPYQSEEKTGSRELFNRTLNKDGKLNVSVKDIIVSSSNEFFSASATYENAENAIGYASYTQMKLLVNGLSSNLTLKALSIDGVSPNSETVKSGEYPITETVYAVIRKDAPSGSAERVLYNWICSEQGTELINAKWY